MVFFKKISKTAGLVPGTPVHIGVKRTEKVRITIIDYDEENLFEKEIVNIEECFPLKDKTTVTWINIDGLHQINIIEKLGKNFKLHPLALEDIVNTDQRPKIEDFDHYLFIVLKMIDYNHKAKRMDTEQVSLIIGHNFVISFQEKEGDVFNNIRDRIRNNKGRIRKMKADYLAYSLMDAVIDNYYVVLEKYGELLEEIEGNIILHPIIKNLQSIKGLKKDMIALRRSVWPLREVINNMIRSESSLIQKTTLMYLRDIYDHTIQVIDIIEANRDMISGLQDIYLSSISNKMNEVMKVLTIIATIFIPLTFIAGVYGMNFKYMPELEWKWGYFFSLGIMLALSIFMLGYFKKKKWL